MKTLIIHNTEVLGITTEELAENDVIAVSIKGVETPLVVYQIIDAPSKIGIEENNEDIELKNDYQKIAYLTSSKKLDKKYLKKTSQKLEKKMAKMLNGRTTPGSGAFSGHKGDVMSEIWLGEHKYTDAEEYRFNRSIWSKISREASEKRKLPVLEIVLDQSNRHYRLIFIDLQNFYDLTHAKEEQLVDFFYFKQYKPKSSSVLLKSEDITEHIEETSKTVAYKIPGIFITFSDGYTLFGMLAKDFEKIFTEVKDA
jgi:hypothetical protein